MRSNILVGKQTEHKNALAKCASLISILTLNIIIINGPDTNRPRLLMT